MKKVILLLVLLMTAFGYTQNQGNIKGTVLDLEMHNEPLLFANVRLQGADMVTETNFHGNFEFANLKSGAYTLVISYAGYEDIEMPVTVGANEIVRLHLGMVAKQISFDVTTGTALSSDPSEPAPTGALPRE